jgi:metal-responsive CopG/Arc/MetJ family transcriptional regulator
MSKTIGAEVNNDLYERVEQAREDGESRSACIRRMVRAQLNERNDAKATAVDWLLRASSVAVGVAVGGQFL